MKTLIDFEQYDIIHSHCLRPDMYIARWKKKINRAKLVSTLHQDLIVVFGINTILFYRICLRNIGVLYSPNLM